MSGEKTLAENARLREALENVRECVRCDGCCGRCALGIEDGDLWAAVNAYIDTALSHTEATKGDETDG